jgi:hypothetical protein
MASPPLSTTLAIAVVTLKRDRPASFIPVTAAGGTAPLVYSISPSLPTGLALNILTGEISGIGRVQTPVTAYTITVTDNDSQTSSKSFTLEIEPAPNKSDPLNRIAAADYNYLRTEIRVILDDLGRDNPAARSSAGYGQVMRSSAVTAGNTITRQQWENLRFDLLNVGLHQLGSIPSISEVVDPIRYTATTPNFRFQDLASSYFNTRFLIGTGRSVINQAASISREGVWTTQCSTTLIVNFPGYIRSDSTVIPAAEHARYFFNAGGKIRFISSRTGGAITVQNASWSSLLSAVGTVQFGGNITDPLGFYKLTVSDQELFRGSPSVPYLSNEYVILARCNNNNNAAGGATQITFTVIWSDAYTDPDLVSGSPQTFPPNDEIDGTLSLTIEEQQPFGPMQPTGTFVVPGPDYSITPIAFA